MNQSTQSPFKWCKISLSLILALFFTSCQDKVDSTHTYRVQMPVYVEVSAFRSMDIGPGPAQTLSSTGKIYVYGDYLFINEPKKGIHVIDNSAPSKPRNLNFISIPGNIDMAVNSNILYADSYIDLLAFDISNPTNIELAERVEGVFPHLFVNQEQSLFLTYKDSVVTHEYPRNPGWIVMEDSRAFSMANGGGASYGQGGSMARFTLMSGHLYALNDHELRLFDIQKADQPAFVNTIPLGWGIETIFPFDDKLFIGSTTGMHIYDASTPSSPVKMAVYQHFTSCDPVVVNETHAFVTLRSGNFCQQGVNLLEVLDIRDPYNPTLLKSYAMQNPHGLGLSDNHLYICEGDFGLKSFNVSDVMNIDKNQLEHLKNKKAFDVIPAPKSLIVIGPDGVCQYDYSTPNKLRLLSCINRRE